MKNIIFTVKKYRVQTRLGRKGFVSKFVYLIIYVNYLTYFIKKVMWLAFKSIYSYIGNVCSVIFGDGQLLPSSKIL